MPSRARDWMAQAERDLEHASISVGAKQYEWACFASHQAAEKAIKAVYQHLGGEARGHNLAGMLQGLAERVPIPGRLLEQAAELGKHYIGPRYPNAHVEDAPFQHYTKAEASRAMRYAEAVLRFCRGLLAGP